MSLSAAELQKRHGLEGAPDPFPSLGGGPAATPAAPSSAKPKSNGSSSIDTSSESAFPSLGASSTSAPAVTKPASSMWSTKATAASKIAKSPATGLVTKAGGLGRAGATGPTASSHPFTDSFSVPANDVASGKQLSETIAKVQKETGVLVESSNQSGRKTFHLRGQDQKRLDKAKALIHRGISKSVTFQVEVPISTFGTIIGPKGATLKSITEATGCKIDIPRRENLPAVDSAAASTADDEADSEDEAEDPTASITITGPSVSAADARARIEALISHKTSQTSTSIKHIPSHFYPFIAGPKGVKARLLEEELGEGDINIAIPPPAVWKALERQANGEQAEEVTETGKNKKDLAIRVRGDKVKVQRVVDEINKQYENLLDSLSELSIGLPKRQHRFLVGQAADEVLEQTGCIIELPRVDDPSDQICIRGPQLALGTALQLSMEKANKIKVETVDVAQQHRNAPNPSGHAKQILHYLIRTQRLRNIAESHSDVKVFPPFAAVVDATGQVVIEVVGEDKTQVQQAKEAVIAAIKEITPAAVQTLEIDFALHKFLIGKKGSKIAQFESANKVTTVFPPAADESSTVTLIYTGPLDAFGPAGKERDGKVKEVLKAAKVELENLAKEAADVKSQTLDIDQKWHKAIIGPGGAILNAIIGEDQIVNVRIGAGPRSQANGKSSSDDANVVVIRGPSTEVDRVVKEIKQVVEDAENDNIVNGYTVEFNVDKKHVPHLVGSSGAAINKLREEFGVKINFDDDDKKSSKPVAQCKIVGRKELVEKAKERVLEQIERLADETTETVNIKRALQPALIGSGGKYAIRLEEKYGVKLSFPRENKDGTAPSKPDEVVIRGGKKGVAQAKAELLEAAAFESETRQSATFTVPTKSVSMIVGKAGATINAIKDDTGAKIDIDKSGGSDDKTTVTVSGDKKAIAAARAAVLAVVEQVGDELTTTLTIEPKFHRTLIGQGGQKLRDLVAACGGPEEAFKQNGLINFPRQGDSNTDQVRLRGDKTLVNKIKAELEKQVKVLRETKVLGVVVPASTHASRIGRGGAALQDLQKKTGAVVHFPGSRSYNSVGEIENAEDVKDADPKEIVKVIGSEEATSKAIEQLSTVIEQTARSGPKGGRTGGNDYPTRTVSIPAKYHHALVEGGNLTRSIRNVGGFLVQPQASQPKPAVSRPTVAEGAKEARIDADDNGDDVEYGWELKANYEGLGDEEEEWVVRAKEENLDKAVNILNQAVEKAKQATHVGALVGLPRSAFPRIIGSKGATISRLRAETGADIHVGQDDDLITITGDETSVEQAKEAIVSIVTRSGGQRY